MDEYSVKLVKASRDLSGRDEIRFTNFSAMTPLDSLVSNDKEVAHITPTAYAQFDVHNELAENKDYTQFIIEADDGSIYKTGSGAFFSRFREIFDTMKKYDPNEVFSISVIKRPSQRYKGKYILLCQLD